MKKILAFMLATVICFSGVVLTQNKVHAVELGGVDLWTACNEQYPGSILELRWPRNVYSWKCVGYWSGTPVLFNIDVAARCRRQYGVGAKASFYDVNNPFSWYCYR